MISSFDAASLKPIQKKLRTQLLQAIYSAGVSHIGSCISTLDIIWSIYQYKKKDDLFVLSNGHAGFSLYTVLAELSLLPVETISQLDIHPHRDMSEHIAVSTGSLGQGLPIVVGMALANKDRHVYCLISDGECSEGSIWESFRFIQKHSLTNVTVFISANGWSAYDEVDVEQLYEQLKGFGFYTYRIDGHNLDQLHSTLYKIQGMNNPVLVFCDTNSHQLPFLKGLQAHYQKLNEEQYRQAIELFND